MKRMLLILLIIPLSLSNILAQRTGVLYGTILDNSTNISLPGANVIIDGTVIGTISDLEGNYRLMGVPVGEHVVNISFVGYDKFTKEITIEAGQTIEVNANLIITSTNLEEVVVTYQMAGQAAAINQQLNSDALVNVVSSDKMRELPDVNAAEAIGRLPGISVNRNGGEAQTINIRGFSADYTSVTINGIKMPETGTGSRTVNLSNISPDLLSHIEVYKSPTADMDGDAVGGIVSLGLKPAGIKPENQVYLETGINLLKNKPNYKGTVRLSRRFFENRFGAILNTSFDNTDRSSQNMSTNYSTYVKDENDIPTGFVINPSDNISLNDVNRRVNRFGMNLQTDYEYENGEVVFQGMLNRKNTNTYNLGYAYDGLSTNTYSLGINENEVNMYQLMLSTKYNLSWLEMDGAISYNRTFNQSPYSPNMSFTDPYAYEDTLRLIESIPDMKNKMDYLSKDFSDATMSRMDWSYDSALNKNISAVLNFKSNYRISSNIAGFVKFGGKVQFDTRSSRHEPYFQRYDYTIEQAFATARWLEVTGEELLIAPNEKIMIQNFDVQDKTSPFWNGSHSVWPFFPESILRNWYDNMNENRRPENDELHMQYDVEESLYAGYIMTKLNIGRMISFVPGLRYEYSDNFYEGRWSNIGGTGNTISGVVRDTSVTKEYGHLLPSAHLKITPLKWMDFRLSYAKTIKRPNYNQLVPTTRVEPNTSTLKDMGNGNLNEMIANSYDASVSFYSGKFGLLSLGVFSKVFTNYITNITYTIPAWEAVEMGLPDAAWTVENYPSNLPDKGYVKGFEIDLQTNFKYLPKPFNGLILNFNITRLWSNTQVEKWEKIEEYDPIQRRMVINFDSSYFYTQDSIRLTSQIDLVLNATIGYAYKGFSFRVSGQYQGIDLRNTLSSGQPIVDQRYNDDWFRLDVAMVQKIGKHFRARFNIANLTNVGEKDYIYQSQYWRNEDRYGAVYQVGLEYNF